MNMNLINAMAALNMITEGKDKYLDEYKAYVIEHKKNVFQYAKWLAENLPEIFEDYDVDMYVFWELIKEHDNSKWREEEFEPYAQYFYGTKDNDFEFNQAWDHHWLNNEHHPEHWNGNDMPYIYILEMLCDWGSFGVKSGNYKELIDYYYSKARDDREKELSENTKKIIEEILSKIEEVA